jgi:hypothetical protein
LEKHSVSRLSYLFAQLHLLSSDSFSSTLLSSNLSLLSASALRCFSSVHIVGSLTSKLPSTNVKLDYFRKSKSLTRESCAKAPRKLEMIAYHYVVVTYPRKLRESKHDGLSVRESSTCGRASTAKAPRKPRGIITNLQKGFQRLSFGSGECTESGFSLRWRPYP